MELLDHWFEDNNEQLVIVNTEHYLGVLRKFWVAFGRRRGINNGFNNMEQLLTPQTIHCNGYGNDLKIVSSAEGVKLNGLHIHQI